MAVNNKRTLLLVSGYIREAESVMDEDNDSTTTTAHNINIIIPVSLIQVCYKFYLNQISKFIQYSSNRALQENRFISLNVNKCMIDSKNIIELGSSSTKVKDELTNLLDPNSALMMAINTNATITNPNPIQSNGDIITLKKPLKKPTINGNLERIKSILPKMTAPFCYIPNISWSVPNSHSISSKLYNFDGILGLYSNTRDFDYRPCLIVFNPSEIYDITQNELYFDIFLSAQPFPSCTQSKQYLYCGPKWGVVSEESDGKLYGLHLNEINDRNYRFKLLTDLDEIMFDSSSFSCDLSMTYLRNKESLFVINSEEHNYTLHKIKCGVFDFNKNKWNSSMISKEKFININPNECGICTNHDENEVVLVNKQKITGKYDFYKEKWNIFGDEHENGAIYCKPPTIWFDNEYVNLLYCAGLVDKTKTSANKEECQLQLSYLDIRENNKKTNKTWTIIDDTNIYNDIKYFNSIF